MQILCRLLSLLACWTAMALVPAHAQAPTPLRDQLVQQAQQWAAAALGRSAAQVQFAPLDDRVQVRACEQPLAFDWPFASRETLRVRCPVAATPWQLYLRVVDGASVRPPAADNSKAAPMTRKLVVARRALPRGTVVQPDMVELADVALGPALVAPLDNTALAVFAEVLRDVPAGAPVQSHDLRRAVLVKQGQMAVLNVGQGQGFQIAVRVEVLQDGRMGEQVRLKNPDSGKTLTGVVTGPNALKGL